MCETKDFGHFWDETGWNFVKAESLGPRKTYLMKVHGI